ncbi:TadE/TadG family type IV pilus assembly protein [Amycolatopsis sp. Hca4]|uniref:TadE/TadG family type IV pilus assembly protein n=1 Tax=Amycolatopsis sp. Hca4 TaxID=2742131 RepID=UPI0015902480|nr:TadE/TadG family type IV pilus assembly protein [Amycolatopsis sp. Hca4]QKV80709.1 pilus assembly protein [Amycolatopsis sp. Hca4]
MPANPVNATARRVCRALPGERGAVTAELVIATPLLLVALLAIIQFALWSHATHVAQAAAAEALAAARVQNGTATAGHAAGRQLLDDLAQGPLRSSQIAVERTSTSASASVQGEAVAVLPGMHLHVHAEAAGGVERFVPDVPGFANSGAVSGENLSGGGR